MLARRRRRRATLKTTLEKCLVFAELAITDKGASIQSPGAWEAGVFVEDKLFISTRLGGALKIL